MKYFQFFIAFVAWVAIFFQFYISYPLWIAKGISPIGAAITFLSYFTVLTNILVAVYFTTIRFSQKSLLQRFFSNPKTSTAIVVYIFIVGLVYNIVLRSIWNPQGLQMFVDEALHSGIPTLVIIYWILAVPKTYLRWNDTFTWLLYPIFYSMYTLLRGEITQWYPYPFIDVTAIGYASTILNIMILFIVFFITSLFFILVGKFQLKITLRMNKEQ